MLPRSHCDSCIVVTAALIVICVLLLPSLICYFLALIVMLPRSHCDPCIVGTDCMQIIRVPAGHNALIGCFASVCSYDMYDV